MLNRLLPPRFLDNRGFTLIEILVTTSIIVFISVIIILNFSHSRVDLTQGTAVFEAAIRQAQTNAVASTTYDGYDPCGWGIHYIDASHYAMYAGPNSSTTTCATINRNYQSGEDTLLGSQSFSDQRIQFSEPFADIYFEPPDPKTYLNNNASLSQSPMVITIMSAGGTCPTNCQSVYVYPTGTIEVQ